MNRRRLAFALLGVGLVWLVCPASAHAWTPGTHIYLGGSVLANLQLLPATIADLLRIFPFEFLYGNIAADSSIAKHYAPLGRHCHYWHVGQEIHDLAETDALRAFGLGYLCHLAADTVAHNYFVPRQLMAPWRGTRKKPSANSGAIAAGGRASGTDPGVSARRGTWTGPGRNGAA